MERLARRNHQEQAAIPVPESRSKILLAKRNLWAKLVSEREDLYGRLGVDTRKKFGESLETSLRIARIKERVGRSIERRLPGVKEIDDAIKNLNEELITRAIAYQEQMFKTQEDLRDLEKLAKHVPPHILEGHRQEVRISAAMPGEDPDLKMGLGLLRERRDTAGISDNLDMSQAAIQTLVLTNRKIGL